MWVLGVVGEGREFAGYLRAVRGSSPSRAGPERGAGAGGGSLSGGRANNLSRRWLVANCFVSLVSAAGAAVSARHGSIWPLLSRQRHLPHSLPPSLCSSYPGFLAVPHTYQACSLLFSSLLFLLPGKPFSQSLAWLTSNPREPFQDHTF